MNARINNIKILEPVKQALETTNKILFKPFDISKWFIIGFCAWLATLGQNQIRLNINFPTNQAQMTQLKNQIMGLFGGNVFVTTSIIGSLLFIVIAVAILMIWLSSRGRFMFLHCLGINSGQITEPWKYYETQGNQLFIFRLIAGLSVMAIFSAVAVLLVLASMLSGQAARTEVLMLVLIFTSSIFVLLPLALVVVSFFTLTYDFIVPDMMITGKTPLQAWKNFGLLLKENVGIIILYLLTTGLINLVFVAIITTAIFMTCLMAACILIIPYIGTVALLPLFAFRRAFALHFIAQFGSEYDIFSFYGDKQPVEHGPDELPYIPERPQSE